MTKYVITFLTTTLFMSLIIHLANYEDMYHTKKQNEMSEQMIRNMSDKIMELESKVADWAVKVYNTIAALAKCGCHKMGPYK